MKAKIFSESADWLVHGLMAAFFYFIMYHLSIPLVWFYFENPGVFAFNFGICILFFILAAAPVSYMFTFLGFAYLCRDKITRHDFMGFSLARGLILVFILFFFHPEAKSLIEQQSLVRFPGFLLYSLCLAGFISDIAVTTGLFINEDRYLYRKNNHPQSVYNLYYGRRA